MLERSEMNVPKFAVRVGTVALVVLAIVPLGSWGCGVGPNISSDTCDSDAECGGWFDPENDQYRCIEGRCVACLEDPDCPNRERPVCCWRDGSSSCVAAGDTGACELHLDLRVDD